MYLYIAYTDGRTEVIQVERFSDLSTNKSGFYYYETMIDACGKGTCIKKEDVLCVEVVSNRTRWLDDIVSDREQKLERTICKKEAQYPSDCSDRPYGGPPPGPTVPEKFDQRTGKVIQAYGIDPFNPHPGR
jgi:hypothetical protein